VYPDVFMAGVSLMGVPCGCWAQDYNDTTGNEGSTDQWSVPCAGGDVSMTGEAWGDLVRSYFEGYTGHRPRLQHWHGSADTTLDIKNLAEDVKEWTNLLGLSETPTGTDTPKSGTTRQFWKNACGFTVYETFELAGVGHAVPFDGKAVAAYFGLDEASAADPEAAACAAGGGGAGGMAGAGAAGGAVAGGRAGSDGEAAGAGVTPGGAAGAGGGGASSGGASGGGRGGFGGNGESGAGGTGGMAVSNEAGQSSTSGGRAPVGGQPGTSGFTALGGREPVAGASNAADAGSAAPETTGCGCAVGGRAGDRAPASAAFLLLALAFTRRRRVERGPLLRRHAHAESKA
jgi:MYXO-CTERM domain-containing protein